MWLFDFFLFSSYKTQNLEQIKPVEKEEVIPEKPQIEETDNDSIHFSANYSNGVHVSKIEAEKVEGKIKIIIYYQSDHEVKVSMNDYKGNHIIGPIHIGKGNSFYFLIEKIMEENVIIEISDQSNKNIITIPKEEILKDIGAAD